MSLLGLYGSMALIFVASAAVGWATLAALGRREWSWVAPALGLAILVVLGATVLLPGRGVTVSIVVVAAIAVSVLVLVRARPGAGSALRVGAPVALLVVLMASIPFVAGGGLDVMGTYVNNDLAFHIYNAEWLRSHEGIEPQQVADGYPIGPHGLVVAVAGLTGVALPEVWTGLLIAIAAITALASLSVLGSQRMWMRTLGALLVGLSYLGASFYVQSAFKETVMALFALGFVLALRQLAPEGESEPFTVANFPGTARDADGAGEEARRIRRRRLVSAAVPPIVFALASVAAYSVPGLAWPVGTLAVWAAFSLGPSRLPAARAAVRERRWLLPAGLVAVVAAGAVATLAWTRAANLIGGREVVGPNALANLFDPVPPQQALGLWLSSDYRIVDVSFLGRGGAATWLLAALGLVAVGLGVVRFARRRELTLFAALVAAVGAYLVGRYSLGPYVGSKALAIAAPLVMLTALVGIAPDEREGSRAWVARALAAAAFMTLALGSSYLALAGARLDRDDHEAQLASFRDQVQGERVLFMGSDEYAAWYLRGASVISPVAAPPGLYQFGDRPGLQRTGERVDFDSYLPPTLDGFDYVIATNSSYASAPPANFRAVDSTGSFTLYERVGAAPPRETLPEGELPGAVLDCDTDEGREISEREGTAYVFERAPVLSPFGDLYGAEATGGSYVELVNEGQPVLKQLDLPAGRWEIAIQYHSLEPVVVDAPGLLHAELPPNSSRVGPYWPVGTIELDEPRDVAITVQPQTRPGLRSLLSFERGRSGPESIFGVLVATPAGGGREAVALSEACGRLVDYYEFANPSE